MAAKLMPARRVHAAHKEVCLSSLDRLRDESQARQLESLVRLAEARACVELSQTVTAEHAQVHAIESM